MKRAQTSEATTRFNKSRQKNFGSTRRSQGSAEFEVPNSFREPSFISNGTDQQVKMQIAKDKLIQIN